MKALWDYPELPYKAIVPWPRVENQSTGSPDWVLSVDLLESWLETCIGPHWAEWTWSMWSLHNPYLCGVGFRLDRNRCLFLLKFGTI